MEISVKALLLFGLFFDEIIAQTGRFIRKDYQVYVLVAVILLAICIALLVLPFIR